VKTLRILLLEDDPLDAELIETTLSTGGLDASLRRVVSQDDFTAALREGWPNLILSDYNLPGFDGIAALRLARELTPAVPFLFVSGAIGEERAIETLRAGATDYVLKSRLPRLVPAVRRALREAEDRAARNRLEEELRQRAIELAQANSRKDQFLALLAHELRNPLGPIVNALHLLRAFPASAAEAAEAHDVIERQVRHLTRLVDDLLEVCRSTQGKLRLRREPVDLAALVRQTVTDHHRALESAGLALTVNVPDQPVWLTGDPTRLAQVLGNLLHNARKFTSRGGSVRLNVSTDVARQRAVLSVADTGIGISPDLLPRIFEPFTQADNSLDRSRGGLGLGLALVRRLVELHGGEVSARSEGVGRGAEFTIALPLETKTNPLPTTARGPVPPTGRLRVLIVEDNKDAARTLRILLTRFGHQVEESHSGRAGVEKARTWQPDVVICDLGLPELDGYEVARQLRADGATAQALLIALSGYGQVEDRSHAQEVGFDLHLTKPADPAELQRLLAQEAAARAGPDTTPAGRAVAVGKRP
jgi:signal transduction histidine kinase